MNRIKTTRHSFCLLKDSFLGNSLRFIELGKVFESVGIPFRSAEMQMMFGILLKGEVKRLSDRSEASPLTNSVSFSSASDFIAALKQRILY